MTPTTTPTLDPQALARWEWASHERRCARAQSGRACDRCQELMQAAEVADGKRWGWL